MRCEAPPKEPLFETRPTDQQLAQIAADAEAQEKGCAAAGGGLRKYISTAGRVAGRAARLPGDRRELVRHHPRRFGVPAGVGGEW
ncbi:hypothetical protein [Streptomyces sp. SID13031]|uniref:hypothetical protein n=1 Tax=Streptomyces sp. SID13031 TaxID=2706046 RepID=UPI0013CCBAF2|nr:hypothetical protein [Streptomyces sp. SID13031]NEA35400.1 hypothetical protein [Streptomyces sp. SID13031]